MNTTRTLFLALALTTGLAIPSAYAGGDDNVVDAVLSGDAIAVIFTPSETAPPSVDECNGTHNCDVGAPSNTGSDDGHQSSGSDDGSSGGDGSGGDNSSDSGSDDSGSDDSSDSGSDGQ